MHIPMRSISVYAIGLLKQLVPLKGAESFLRHMWR